MNKENLTKLMLLTACIKEGLNNLNEKGMNERLIIANQKIEDILMKDYNNKK